MGVDCIKSFDSPTVARVVYLRLKTPPRSIPLQGIQQTAAESLKHVMRKIRTAEDDGIGRRERGTWHDSELRSGNG